MQRDRRQVTGRGYCILSKDRSIFVNAGLGETRYVTDHRLILAVLRGEVVIRSRCYQWERTCWPIQPKAIRPQTKGGSSFVVLKGEVSKVPRPIKVRAS